MIPSGILLEEEPTIEIKNVRVWIRMNSDEECNGEMLKRHIDNEYNKYISSIMNGIL